MPDPSFHETGIFGIKAGTIAFGFAGSVLSLTYVRELTLTYVRELTPRLAALSVITGLIVAISCTPLLAFSLNVPEQSRYEYGLAFLLGLTAMHLVPAALKAAELIKKNPSSLLGKFFNKGGE